MGCTPQPAGLLEVSAPCPPSNMPSVPRTAQPRIPASPAARSLRLTASRFPPDPAPRPSQMDGQGQGPGGLTLSHLRPRRDLGQVPRFPLRGAARLESGVAYSPAPTALPPAALAARAPPTPPLRSRRRGPSSRAALSSQTLVYAARTGRARFPNAACAASAWPSRRPARLYAADAARPRWRRGCRRGWRQRRGRRPWRQRGRQP